MTQHQAPTRKPAPRMVPTTQTYRVVGGNGDSRIVLDEGLTHERAEQIMRLLLVANAFPTLRIEAEAAKLLSQP